MEILCDRNVADKYYQAFLATEWISVRRVAAVLPVTAPDSAIIAVARDGGWVVFTSDVRFLDEDEPGDGRFATMSATGCGVLFYRQREDPNPGAVVDAISAIAQRYDDHREIREFVPGEWI